MARLILRRPSTIKTRLVRRVALRFDVAGTTGLIVVLQVLADRIGVAGHIGRPSIRCFFRKIEQCAVEAQLPIPNLFGCGWLRAALAIRHDENVDYMAI
jgi:hypothetical protein